MRVRGVLILSGLLMVPGGAFAGEPADDPPGLELRLSGGAANLVNRLRSVVGEVSGEFIAHTKRWGHGLGIGGAASVQIFNQRRPRTGVRVGLLLALNRQLRRWPAVILSPNLIVGYGAWIYQQQGFRYTSVELGVPLRVRLPRSWEVVVRLVQCEAQIDRFGASLLVKSAVGFGYNF